MIKFWDTLHWLFLNWVIRPNDFMIDKIITTNTNIEVWLWHKANPNYDPIDKTKVNYLSKENNNDRYS